MAQWHFDAETAVTAIGPGRWSTRLSPAWNIGDNPNGGYAAAAALRAACRVTEQPDPVSVTTHYLRPAVADRDAEIVTELVRKGRRAVNVTASLHQDGKERLRMIAAVADLERAAPDTGQPALSPPMVELPAPEHCVPRDTLGQGVELAITSRVDVRIAPALAEPGASDRAEMAGWVRFADGRPVDSAALVLFADAFPPSLYSLLGAVGWVPTLELTVHVRRRPAPGWIATRFRTSDLAGGMMVEDGELWDETGVLVARSRQLALLLTE
ncbi:thioesterase family protein [Aquisalimonas sp.]|uniref:thioesterase family protein n=1 Tax=Aquisalimonas sp. TaxID=1872621 RepID=UPI0025BED36F|nr:thioesterase family protein [Aquisalimonas sp.]